MVQYPGQINVNTTVNGTLDVTGATTLDNGLTVTGNQVMTTRNAAGDWAYVANETGDAGNRIQVNASGVINWGDGTNATDTNLYRLAAGILKTDNDVSVNGNLDTGMSALRMPTPVNHGLVAWTYDPTSSVNSTVLTNGTVYLSAIYPTENVSVTTIYWHVAVSGATPTAGENEVGLYSSAGTLLHSVNVDADISATGLVASTITSAALTAGSMYWVGFVFNAATPPGLARGAGLAAAAAVNNVGLAASSYRAATNGTLQTALPATITPASNSAGLLYWAAVA